MTKNVLVIDNDVDDRDLFSEAMATIVPYYVCKTAKNGKEALAYLDTLLEELPDLIFLDLNMPVMSGLRFLRLLKEQEAYKDIPVIMYSTSTSNDDYQKAYDEGAIYFFSKPSNYKNLLTSLESIVFHLNSNTLPLLKLTFPFFG